MRSQEWSQEPSPLAGRSTFPPVDRGLIADHGCRGLEIEQITELPQFLRRPRVLKKDSIQLVSIKFTGAVAIDGSADVVNKVSQLLVVMFRDYRACRLSLRLAGHEYEATQSPASQRHYLMGSRGPRHDRAPAGAIRPRHGEARLTGAAANAWVGALPSTPDDLAIGAEVVACVVQPDEVLGWFADARAVVGG